MDSGFVREGVIADNRLVRRHRLSDDLREQARGRIDLARFDAGAYLHQVLARLERHHDLFHRGIAGTLADSVDGAFDLARAITDRGERIRHRQAQVVVAMRTPDNLGRARYAFAHIREHAAKFLGDSVTGRVRQVDYLRAGANHLGADLDHE